MNQILRQTLRWGVLATALLTIAGATTTTAYGQGGTLPATKVGTVNIGLLFTKYIKAQDMKKTLETDLAPLKAEAEKIKNVMKQHKDWLDKYGTTDATQAEKSTKALRDGQRALEDLDMQARKLIGKKQEAQLIELYKDIHASVQQYAQQNGYNIVLAYGDPPDADTFTFANINRKMSGMDMGAAVPFYTQPGLDISNEVLARLNSGRVPATPVSNGGATAPPVIRPAGGQQ